MNAPCHDCRVETLPTDEDGRAEWYVVHDELWARAGLGPHGYLCIGCLERRLRRRLLPGDFTDAPVNNPKMRATPRFAWSYRTRRLRDRLLGRGLLPLQDPPGQGRLF